MRTFSLQLQLLVRSAAAPLVELLAPPRCGICECEGALLCAECRAEWITDRAVALPAGNLSAAAALGPYEGGLGAAIRTMKYGGVQGLARELGEALLPAIKQVSARAAFQVTLVPIPTDQGRVHERGFDGRLFEGPNGEPLDFSLHQSMDHTSGNAYTRSASTTGVGNAPLLNWLWEEALKEWA